MGDPARRRASVGRRRCGRPQRIHRCGVPGMSAQVRVLNLADVVPDDLAEDIEWTIGDEVKNSVHALIAEHAQGAIKLAAISARRDEKRLSNEREARHASKPTTTDYRTRIDAALHVGLAVLNIPKPDELV